MGAQLAVQKCTRDRAKSTEVEVTCSRSQFQDERPGCWAVAVARSLRTTIAFSRKARRYPSLLTGECSGPRTADLLPTISCAKEVCRDCLLTWMSALANLEAIIDYEP